MLAVRALPAARTAGRRAARARSGPVRPDRSGAHHCVTGRQKPGFLIHGHVTQDDHQGNGRRPWPAGLSRRPSPRPPPCRPGVHARRAADLERLRRVRGPDGGAGSPAVHRPGGRCARERRAPDLRAVRRRGVRRRSRGAARRWPSPGCWRSPGPGRPRPPPGAGGPGVPAGPTVRPHRRAARRRRRSPAVAMSSRSVRGSHAPLRPAGRRPHRRSRAPTPPRRVERGAEAYAALSGGHRRGRTVLGVS